MGLTLFLLFAIIEVALVIWTCKKEKEKKKWRRNRMISRGVQTALPVISILLPIGQKWRLMPVLGLLIFLLLLSALIMVLKRGKEDGMKKTGGIIVSCVFSMIFLGLSLVPAFVFTGYKGLPVSGDHKVLQASAVLVDESRTDPFENDGSSREVPVHFYYPDVPEDSTEKFPLVVFSHGAFGYYQSNVSTYMELVSHGYVVVSLDHPYHSFFTKGSDGSLITVDPKYLQSVLDSSNGKLEEKEEYLLEKEWMEIRVPDMNFALEQIKDASGKETLSSVWVFSNDSAEDIEKIIALIDKEKIGVMGHSMGGATSVEIGRERDDIDAVACIDGTMLGEYTGYQNEKYSFNDEPYIVPLLDFSNEAHHKDREEYRKKGKESY